MAISHATKKFFSRATTGQKKIDKGLNQEFVDSRRRLTDICTCVKSSKKAIHSSRQVWTNVAKHHRDFSKTLASSFPESGEVQAHANEVEEMLRNVQETIVEQDSDESAHERMVKILDKYIVLIQSIESEYKKVETSYTEKERYQRKVDKLEKKAKKKSENYKKKQKLNRNIEKMNEAQKKLDANLKNTLNRMRSALDKHQAILQCAHHAYWMANNAYLNTIVNSTNDIRMESVQIHQRLLPIQVDENKTLLPIPRIHLIQNQQQQQQQQQQHQVVDDDDADTISTGNTNSIITDTKPSQHIIPTVTSKNGTILNNIPDLPTEKPKDPENIKSEIPVNVTTTTNNEPVAA